MDKELLDCWNEYKEIGLKDLIMDPLPTAFAAAKEAVLSNPYNPGRAALAMELLEFVITEMYPQDE